MLSNINHTSFKNLSFSSGQRPPTLGQNPTQFFQRQNSTDFAPRPPSGDDGEDTMKNLRKTFAGIFGDM